MKLSERIMKNLKEAVGDFDENSDPVEILEAIYTQYEESNMTGDFFQDLVNYTNLSVKDLVDWYNMGEE